MTRIRLGNDTSDRPLTVDYSTLAKLRLAEARLGHTFTIVQGSWRGEDGADASAGTHDRGGVIDLRSRDLPTSITPRQAVTALRRAGLIAWYRTQAQGFDPHIHAIDHGNPDLAPSAANQVIAWRNGRNGLANNGPDDGARVPVPTATPTEGFMFLTKDDLDAIDKRTRAIVKEELAIERPKSADAVWLHQLTNRVTKGKIGAGAVLEYMHEDVHGLSAAEVEPDPKA